MCKGWRDGGLWEAIIQNKIGRKIIVFGVVKLHIESPQRAKSTPAAFSFVCLAKNQFFFVLEKRSKNNIPFLLRFRDKKDRINFGVVAFRFKFNQRTMSTPHKFKAHASSQKSILFRPRKEK